jgi:hypothetical protein
MTTEDLEKFCSDQPKAAENLIDAFKRAIDFRNTRMRIVRGLPPVFQPQIPAKPKLYLIK